MVSEIHSVIEETSLIDGLEQLVAQRCPTGKPTPPELALLSFVQCGELKKAFDLLKKETRRFADLWGSRTVDDALVIVKIWNGGLDPLGQAALYYAVASQFGVGEMDTEVPTIIQEGTAAFLQELPALMSDHPKQWVAYHGSKRVGFGLSDYQLLRECVAQGLPDDELVIRRIQPDIPTIQVTW